MRTNYRLTILGLLLLTACGNKSYNYCNTVKDNTTGAWLIKDVDNFKWDMCNKYGPSGHDYDYLGVPNE